MSSLQQRVGQKRASASAALAAAGVLGNSGPAAVDKVDSAWDKGFSKDWDKGWSKDGNRLS